jgi:hypothetical protein
MDKEGKRKGNVIRESRVARKRKKTKPEEIAGRRRKNKGKIAEHSDGIKQSLRHRHIALLHHEGKGDHS